MHICILHLTRSTISPTLVMYNFQSVHVNKVLESRRYHECHMQNRTFYDYGTKSGTY